MGTKLDELYDALMESYKNIDKEFGKPNYIVMGPKEIYFPVQCAKKEYIDLFLTGASPAVVPADKLDTKLLYAHISKDKPWMRGSGATTALLVSALGFLVHVTPSPRVLFLSQSKQHAFKYAQELLNTYYLGVIAYVEKYPDIKIVLPNKATIEFRNIGEPYIPSTFNHIVIDSGPPLLTSQMSPDIYKEMTQQQVSAEFAKMFVGDPIKTGTSIIFSTTYSTGFQTINIRSKEKLSGVFLLDSARGRFRVHYGENSTEFFANLPFFFDFSKTVVRITEHDAFGGLPSGGHGLSVEIPKKTPVQLHPRARRCERYIEAK